MTLLPSKLRASALAACAAGLLACAGAAPAVASPGQFTVFEAPDLMLNPSTQRATVDELAALGVDSIRFVMYWRDVAPLADQATRPPLDLTDPAMYGRAWAPYDGLIAAAEGHNMRILMTVSGPVPRWATRNQRDQVTEPSPVEFERFMLAVGRRYGDFVDVWSIWNEPNHPLFLQPQFRNGGAVSPSIYRELFVAGERGLEVSGKVGSSVPILMGETAPRGTGRVVAPLRFLRGALCLDSRYRRSRRCGRVRADGWATHPYTVAGNPFFRPSNPDDVTIGVIPRLQRALDRAGRAGAVRSRLPIYLTEFGVQSTPDPFAASLTEQHEFRGIAERIAYRSSRVRAFSQYLLRDSQPRSGPPSERYSGFESGLRFSDGREKPSYGAFRLPIVIERSGRRVNIWGLVRPARGRTSAVVEVADRGGAFRRLRTVRTNSRGYFSLRSSDRAGRRWRLVWRNAEGARFTGPPTRAYSRR